MCRNNKKTTVRSTDVVPLFVKADEDAYKMELVGSDLRYLIGHHITLESINTYERHMIHASLQ